MQDFGVTLTWQIYLLFLIKISGPNSHTNQIADKSSSCDCGDSVHITARGNLDDIHTHNIAFFY